MTYKEFKQELSKEKYNPLPKKEANEMAVNGTDKEKLAMSCFRLIPKAINKRFSFTTKNDLLMELVSGGQDGISYAINTYKYNKIDFGYYAYVSIINFMHSTLKDLNLIKSTTINGEKKYATYTSIDAPRENPIDFPIEEYQEELSLDTELIYELLSKDKHAIKRSAWDIFLLSYGFIDGERYTDVAVAKKVGLTPETISRNNKRVIRKLKENEKIMNYFSEFFSF
jgi:RNA polymerase sigma factor (sigma-70 family)